MHSVKRRVQELTNSLLGIFGLEVTRRGLNPSWYARLRHMRELGFAPRVIFDCGAFLGTWTLKASGLFPGARFLLVEPNQSIIARTRTNISAVRPTPVVLEAAVG